MRRLIGSLVLLIAVAVGVAIYANWLSFSTTENADKTQVRMDIDKEKMKQDIGDLEKKAENLKDRVNEKIQQKEKRTDKETTVNGTIAVVDKDNNHVTLTTPDNKKLTVEITADTQIRVGREMANLNELRVGQEATCVHSEKNGKDVCSSLTVGERGGVSAPRPPAR
jgi:hypothetical protein